MPKLFLVGITPDHRALVLSEHARAKRGDMVLEIDDRLLEAIDKAQRLRAFDEGNRLESAALPSKREVVSGDGTEVARLSPREIQQRLRAGESITALARSSGTDEAWIRRFAAPVLAEQSKVIEQARATTFTKRGVGASAVPLGSAVAANVIDRGVPLTLPELEAGWGAYQRPEGGWHVTFTFPLRGRRQTAEWEVDPTGDLTGRNKLASELGWRESGRKLPQPKPAKVAAPKPAATAPSAEPRPKPSATVPSADPGSEPGAPPEEPEAAQVLPLTDREGPASPAGPASSGPAPSEGPASPAGPARKAPSARKAPPAARKTPAPRAAARKSAPTAKRTAAAVAEAPAQSVVPVAPAGSMPPTDLDVVDVPGGFPLHDDGEQEREQERVIVLPPSPEDEAVEAPRAADDASGGPRASLDDDDGPTGPISLAARPHPAPLGAQPAPRGGPPAP